MVKSRFSEVWIEAPDGQSLCALINDGVGWLMYLRQAEDPGFSSRNPTYEGPADARIAYRLNNGQIDEYPASWAYPIEEVERALAYFRAHAKPPPFICWHNDSMDEASIGPALP